MSPFLAITVAGGSSWGINSFLNTNRMIIALLEQFKMSTISGTGRFLFTILYALLIGLSTAGLFLLINYLV